MMKIQKETSQASDALATLAELDKDNVTEY